MNKAGTCISSVPYGKRKKPPVSTCVALLNGDNMTSQNSVLSPGAHTLMRLSRLTM